MYKELKNESCRRVDDGKMVKTVIRLENHVKNKGNKRRDLGCRNIEDCWGRGGGTEKIGD